MRILLGPHPKDSPEALELEAANKPFVTPIELADMAVRLAQLKGLKEPDVEGAIKLIRRTWTARHALTPLACAGLQLTFQLRGGAVMATVAPDHCDKEFAGAEEIAEPSAFPVSLDEAVRLISGEYNRKRRRSFLLRMENHDREAMGLPLVSESQSDDDDVEDRASYWSLARKLVPHCPRFARLHGKTQASVAEARPKGSRKSRKVKKSS